LAYDSLRLAKQQILTENDAIRLARTTYHQLDMVLTFKKQIVESRWLDLKFEDLMAKPEQAISCLADFSAKEMLSKKIMKTIDLNRATITYTEHSKETIKLVHTILDPIRSELGYH
ncbi:MAG: hypothetical protein HAW67_07875, partial [Endozoicomonadaceae bacterium]|nr:hypothetical protein [Endozoicomonadaceae bacterium]